MSPEDIQFWSMIGTWVAGMGTVSAVIVSLYLAISERKVSLSITSEIFVFDDNNERIIIKISNKGSRPVIIENNACIAFQAGWWKNKKNLGIGSNYIFLPNGIRFPYRLDLGDCLDFGINLVNQNGNWLENFKSTFLKNRSILTLRVIVYPNASKPIKVKPGKTIIQRLKS